MGIGKGRGEWKGGETKIWTEILTLDLTPPPPTSLSMDPLLIVIRVIYFGFCISTFCFYNRINYLPLIVSITSNDCSFGCPIIYKDTIHFVILFINSSTMLHTKNLIHSFEALFDDNC